MRPWEKANKFLGWMLRNWEYHKRDRKYITSRLGGRHSWKPRSVFSADVHIFLMRRGILN